MQAVWSFWSKPFKADRGLRWNKPHHHLLAWGLSLRLARMHFERTVLVTDSAGKAFLVDELGLKFDNVSTELDRLRDVDPGWWALGKLLAYSLQKQPFVHLDNDVFLWKPLSSKILASPVIAQCPEQHSVVNPWCDPGEVERRFRLFGLALPVEWEWAISRRGNAWFREENCGIVGGNQVDFLRHYAESAIAMVIDPQYQRLWASSPIQFGFNMVIEQYFLAVCLDYHKGPHSRFSGLSIEYLFPNWVDALDPHAACRVGYTHLQGETKAHPLVGARLEQRMASMDPKFLRRCHKVTESSRG